MTAHHTTLATKLAGTVDYPFYEPRDPDNLPVVAVTREAWESYAMEPDAVIELGGGEPVVVWRGCCYFVAAVA